MPAVLTLSGSDPSGGAGLEADLKTFQAHGVHGMAIPTLLTVQNTTGIRKVKHLPPDFLEEQFDFLLEDMAPAVIKIGAVGAREMVTALVRLLSRRRLRDVPVVIDTVMASTSGQALFDLRGLSDYMDRLLPLARLITPNAPEFGLLSGRDANAANAVAHLMAFGRDKPYAILLKGGHWAGDPIDHLYAEGKVTSFPGKRLESRNTHGTGCALAAAISANLALGHDLVAAVGRAREFVPRAIESAPGLGRGKGPMNFSTQA